jgi:peptide deformylase
MDMMVKLTDTLDAAEGVGLAAPQIDEPIKMFMVDTARIYIRLHDENRASYFPEGKGIRELFINARITKRSVETSIDTEGCLSIPTIFEEIQRNWQIEIEYLDSQFQRQSGQFSGLTARAIQHEIDHTQGILFVDHLSPLKKRLLANKLRQISKGKVSINYPMIFTG